MPICFVHSRLRSTDAGLIMYCYDPPRLQSSLQTIQVIHCGSAQSRLAVVAGIAGTTSAKSGDNQCSQQPGRGSYKLQMTTNVTTQAMGGLEEETLLVGENRESYEKVSICCF